jgi:hypothetical protein
LQKSFDIATPKALDSPDSVTGQFTSPDHAVDGHRGELKQFSELTDSVEFGLGVVLRSRSLHVPLSLFSRVPPDQLHDVSAALSLGNQRRLSSFFSSRRAYFANAAPQRDRLMLTGT